MDWYVRVDIYLRGVVDYSGAQLHIYRQAMASEKKLSAKKSNVSENDVEPMISPDIDEVSDARRLDHQL